MMKKTIMAGILVGFLVMVALPLNTQIEHITLRVDGLACPFCAYGLEKKLKDIKSITTYDIDMKEGKVNLEVKTDVQIDINSFNKAVKESGFTLRDISLRVRGKIDETEEGLILLTSGKNEKFLLFEDEVSLEKFHQGERIKTLSEDLKKKLIEIKQQGKEVVIEGVVHEHKDYPAGLSIDHLELIE